MNVQANGRYLEGEFESNIETTERRYFSEDEPYELAEEKCTLEQIMLCFEANNSPQWTTQFD